MVAALVFIGVSIGGVAYLVTSLVVSTVAAIVMTAVMIAVAVVLWWVVPVGGAVASESRRGGYRGWRP